MPSSGKQVWPFLSPGSIHHYVAWHSPICPLSSSKLCFLSCVKKRKWIGRRICTLGGTTCTLGGACTSLARWWWRPLAPGGWGGRGVNHRPHWKTGNPSCHEAKVQSSDWSVEDGRWNKNKISKIWLFKVLLFFEIGPEMVDGKECIFFLLPQPGPLSHTFGGIYSPL